MADAINYRTIGIPVEEVGPRLKKLNEAIKDCGMCIKADTDVNISFNRDQTALSLKLEVYLFAEEKKNG